MGCWPPTPASILNQNPADLGIPNRFGKIRSGSSLGIRLPLPDLLSERVQEQLVPASATPMHNRRRRFMKMLIPALAYAIVIVAPGLTEPANARAAARKTEPAASKLGGDSFLSEQNEKCYWRWQCDIIDDEKTRLHY